MAKGNSNDTMPVLGGVFCFFVVFLNLLGLLSSFSIPALLMPALWLLLGLCLMTKKKSWLCVVGLLPLVILTIQSAWATIPTDSVEAFLNALLCRVFPAVGLTMLFVLMFLCAMGSATKFRRELWLVPIILALPECIWHYGSAVTWAEFGMVASVSYWIKPGGR